MVASSDKNPQNGVQGTSYLYQFGTTPNTRTAVSQRNRVLTPVYGNNAALHQMGVLGTFGVDQSRTIDNVRGIGFGDKVAELVPSIQEPVTVSLERALLYLCNIWQATGYAAGVDGPVRMLTHHRWPFDIEQQLVFSTLADADIGAASTGGYGGTSGNFDGGVKAIAYPEVTQDAGNPRSPTSASRGHTAIITIYEACWFNATGSSFAKDSGLVMETANVTVSDIHDFASVYGEFLATGNDPTIGQLGSIRFASLEGARFDGASGSGIGGGGAALQLGG
jgi:hypothetical protein